MSPSPSSNAPRHPRRGLRGRLAALAGAVLLATAGLFTLAAPAHATGGVSVTGVSPSQGPTSGGTSVTITGTGFLDNDCLASAGHVYFDGNQASFTINGDTSITATAPAHAAGTVDVVVEAIDANCHSDVTSADHYTYVSTPSYSFTGFFSPVHNPPTVNTMNAGRAVPVKFSLSGNQGLDIFNSGYPASQQVTCDTNAPLSPVEETSGAGQSSLSYDSGSDTYTYVWKTDSAWSNTCRTFLLGLKDNSTHNANFKFS
ncbi:PxKF domain-containing protein [Streptomyces violascens]|uniref:PxKF domain-containing protein n=1 Tax=Streptomyces violascens TaxID=67381 RepID=UPI00368B431D